MRIRAIEIWEGMRAFIDLGGGAVLWALFAVTLLMWTLILERLYYFQLILPAQLKAAEGEWKRRSECASWYAKQIRTLLISRVSLSAHHSVDLIKSLVAVCPLLGLLGTVMGMLEVFHVLSVSGGGNIRAMAAGVSAATVSTMAGMVAALSGLFFSVRLKRRAERAVRQLDDLLAME